MNCAAFLSTFSPTHLVTLLLMARAGLATVSFRDARLGILVGVGFGRTRLCGQAEQQH
jgi:hypothetical protein